jgi:hypothetical protein
VPVVVISMVKLVIVVMVTVIIVIMGVDNPIQHLCLR